MYKTLMKDVSDDTQHIKQQWETNYMSFWMTIQRGVGSQLWKEFD